MPKAGVGTNLKIYFPVAEKQSWISRTED